MSGDHRRNHGLARTSKFSGYDSNELDKNRYG